MFWTNSRFVYGYIAIVDRVLSGNAKRWREKTYGLIRRVSDAERHFERDISSLRFERARENSTSDVHGFGKLIISNFS